MTLPAQTRRRLALCVAGLQLLTVAHMALVAHTADAEGQVADAAFGIQQHLDAAMHEGTHAHAAAPPGLGQGEETCAVASLLHATDDGRVFVAALWAPDTCPSLPPDARAESGTPRRSVLLAAPKASPPSRAES